VPGIGPHTAATIKNVLAAHDSAGDNRGKTVSVNTATGEIEEI